MAKNLRSEDRDQQILSRLANIEHKVDSIDETNAFALRAEASKHMDTVHKIFNRGVRRAQIYLAADGTKGVLEIANHLRMKYQNVGPELKILKEEGLLEINAVTDRRDIWGKKPIDRTLRISKYLCATYALKPNGHFDKAKMGRGRKGPKMKNSRSAASRKRR